MTVNFNLRRFLKWSESRVFKLMNGVTLEMLGEAVEGF